MEFESEFSINYQIQQQQQIQQFYEDLNSNFTHEIEFKYKSFDHGFDHFEEFDDDKLIWNTLYDQLESAYGGWEIDDGSSGTIELNNNLEIVISHEWSMREMETCEGRYVITENDIEEE